MTHHKTKFDDMNQVQRSLHNLIHILDDDCLQTYEASLSEAIDTITQLEQQRDELQTKYHNLVLASEKSADLLLDAANQRDMLLAALRVISDCIVIADDNAENHALDCNGDIRRHLRYAMAIAIKAQ